MPELPEVEATRLSFANGIKGARVLAVRMGKALRWPLGCPPSHLDGRTVRAVRRRGKYLLMDLDQGLLLLHLGMSGSLVFSHQLPAAGPHDHFEMQTSQGTLRLHDPRRFGAVVFADHEDAPVVQKLLGKLGVEPLSEGFDVRHFHAALKRRKTAIKQVLLAGDVVVGVGNIYACEALFRAGICPTVPANALGRVRVARLHTAIREVLARALAIGGSTLRNFSNALGNPGHFQIEAMVYGRAGQACRVCETLIESIKQGQRSTFFCPHCQKS